MPVSLTRSRTLRPVRALESPGDGVGVHGDVAGVDGQRAASGHGVAGVDREVHQHLVQLARVGQDRPQVTGERGDQLDVLADGPAQHFLDCCDDAVQVENLWPDHVAPGEDEQLVGKPGRALGSLLDLREVSAGRFQVPGRFRAGRGRGGGDFLGDEGDVVENHGEQVVEVMRDPARELAEALQTLGLRLQSFLALQGLAVRTAFSVSLVLSALSHVKHPQTRRKAPAAPSS